MEQQLSDGEIKENALRGGGFSDQEINQWKGEAAQNLQDGGFSQSEIQSYFGQKPFNVNPLKDTVKKNLASAQADQASTTTKREPIDVSPKPVEAKDVLDSMAAGWGNGFLSLFASGKESPIQNSENATVAQSLASASTQMIGDLPAMAAGAAGGAELGPVGSAAGAFAAPAAFRKMLIDKYQRGEATDAGEVARRAVGATWEATKGALTGAATALSGGFGGALAGTTGRLAAEVAAQTTVSSALEGHLPDKRDFINGAVAIAGFHAVTAGIGKATALPEKMMNVYAETGAQPGEILEAMNKDPSLKGEMLSDNPDLPKEAAPPPSPEGPQKPEGGSSKDILPQKVKPGFELPEDERKEVLSRIGDDQEETKESMYQKAKDGSLDFYVNTFDKTARLKNILDKIGDEKLDKKNSYVLARTFSDVNSKVDQVINKNTIDPLTNNKNGEGLMKILNDYAKETGDKSLDNLKTFMISARSLELEKRGIIQPGNRANDQAIFGAGKGSYDGYAKRLVDFQNRNLDYAKGKGLLSDDQVSAMKDANKYYIPLHKIVEADNITGTMGGTNSLKKIGDSLLSLKDPIDSMFKNTEVLIKAADRNDIMRQAAKDLMSGDGLAEEVEKDSKITNVSKEELNSALKAQDITLNDQTLDGFNVFRKVPSQYRGPGIFTFRDGGELHVMKTDPGVADVLNSYSDNYQAMGLFTKIFRTAAQSLRAATIQNPLTGFFARHIIRNQEQAAVFSQTGLKPFQALGDLVTGKDTDAWDQFIRDGGAVSSMEKIPEAYYTDTIKKMDEKMPFSDWAWNKIDSVTGFSHMAIMANDNMIRFKEYQRTLDKGGSRTEAAMNARNVLADFQKEGLKKSFIQSTTAFFKAHYQGEFQMFGALADPEQRMGVLARNIGYITVPSIMLGLAQASDDRINSLPDWLKYNYWNVHLPHWRDAEINEATSQGNAYPDEVRQKPDGSWQVNDGYTFRIPKPFANGAFFGSAVEEMYRDYQKKDPGHFAKFLESVGEKMIAGPVPTALEPVLEQATNRNFFGGKPLVRSEMERNKLPEMQYMPYTSKLARFLGDKIADVPLIRDIGPEDAKLASPVVIDNYINAWTGGSAKYLLGTVDKIMGVADKGIPVISDMFKDLKLEQVPFFREFLVRHDLESQDVTDFMNSQNMANKVIGSIKELQKQGDVAGVVKLQDRYATEGFKVGKYQEGIQNMMSMIHKVNDSDMDVVQKRQLSDGLSYQIISAAKHGNEMIQSLKDDMKGK